MKRIWAVLKKELKRFFTDIRMVLALVLPGIAIFITYTIVGDVLSPEKISEIDKFYQFNVALTNNYSLQEGKESNFERALSSVMETMEYKAPKYEYFEPDAKDDYLSRLKNKEFDAVLVFDDGFEDKIFANIDPLNKPNVNLYYNSETKESEMLFNYIGQTMGIIYSSFSINADIENPNVGERSNMMGLVMGIIIPIITMSLLYSTTLTVCPESIAGEKERGTLSSILITPIKRSEFAIGKILALIIVSLFGGVISGAGMLLSLPKLMGVSDMVILSALDYTMLFFVILSLVLVFVSIATTVSTYAKSTKEANSLLSPLIAILMVIGMIPGFINCSSIGFAFVPILNSAQVMFAIVNGQLDILYLGLTLLSNLIVSIALVFVDIKLFKTESIVMRQ